MADDATLIREARDALAALNRALEAAFHAGLTADLTVDAKGIVGRPAPLVRVSGRLSRTRIELDERL